MKYLVEILEDFNGYRKGMIVIVDYVELRGNEGKFRILRSLLFDDYYKKEIKWLH